MSAKFPLPGEVFEGAYRIEAILGSGGFARVYRATEVGLERPVALKILRPPSQKGDSEANDDYLETLIERFQREAHMLSRLRSAYTVNLFKFGKTEAGLLYMALEYIDGLSLAEILRAGKPLAPERVAKILKQVLMSLQEAHALGMLHRDLKPANIMVYDLLGERDKVKLLDFGIAKLVSEHGSSQQQDLTGDGTLIGTPRYMAPEQIQGSQIGPASDIYALGLVAFELLTGERAIPGDSSIQIIGKQLAPESFKLPAGDRVPPGLRFVVDKMMEKDISFRYANCAEVIEDLNRPTLLVEDLEDIPELEIGLVTALEPGASLDHLPASTSREFLRDDTAQRARPDRRKFAIVGILGALLIVTVVAALLFREEPAPAPAPVVTVNPPEPPPREPEPPKPEPRVTITARLDGAALEGVAILVDGVEKGVTPLTLNASEIRDARVVARYAMPDHDGPVETAQEVTDPRDVLFEFDAAVSELIKLEAPPDPSAVEPTPQPSRRVQKRGDRQGKDRSTNRNVYVAPE